MKMYNLIMIVLLIIIQSCKKQNSDNIPDAIFTMSSANVSINEKFNLINNSINSSSYKWEINDVNLSTDISLYNQNIDSVGVYNIKLTAYNSIGKSNSTIKKITVNNQFIDYTGIWNIVEKEQLSPNTTYTYTSSINFNNKGDALFTELTKNKIPITLKNNKSYNNYHIVYDYIIDSINNKKIRASITFTQTGILKQFSGFIDYYEGSFFISRSMISAEKQ